MVGTPPDAVNDLGDNRLSLWEWIKPCAARVRGAYFSQTLMSYAPLTPALSQRERELEQVEDAIGGVDQVVDLPLGHRRGERACQIGREHDALTQHRQVEAFDVGLLGAGG